jgi:hypothetical protein
MLKNQSVIIFKNGASTIFKNRHLLILRILIFFGMHPLQSRAIKPKQEGSEKGDSQYVILKNICKKYFYLFNVFFIN